MTSGTGLIGRLRQFGDSPELLAIRTRLPLSFGGLIAGLAVFFFIEHGTAGERFYHAFIAGFAVMAITLVVLLGWDLARRREVPEFLAVAIALAAFAVSLPYHGGFAPLDLAYRIGPSGLFLAMFACLASVGALRFFRARFGPAAGDVAAAIVVAGGAAGIAASGICLADVLTQMLAPLGRLGDTLWALLLITLIEVLLWAIGIHGPAMLAAVVLPVYLQLQAQNTAAYTHHQPLPHIVVVSIFLFIFPGGAGATLPLVLMLLRSKHKRVRSVALASLGPAIFGANEPLMFGLPVVFNPILAVPFVIAPMALATITYFAIALGLVARPAYYVPSTIPQPLGVYLATLDWRSVLLVLFNIGVSAAIYAPFVARYERAQSEKAAELAPLSKEAAAGA